MTGGNGKLKAKNINTMDENREKTDVGEQMIKRQVIGGPKKQHLTSNRCHQASVISHPSDLAGRSSKSENRTLFQ